MKVFVTGPVPEAGLVVLREATGVEVSRNPSDRRLTSAEILEGARGCSAVLSMLYDPLDRTTIEALHAQGVGVIANFAVGYDNIDVPAATDLGVAIVHTPGVLTEATADLAWALILGGARRVGQGEQVVRAGSFRGWDPTLLLGAMVHGRTLGILGLGRIGTAVARRARGFDMEVIYSGRGERPELAREVGASYVSFEELLARSDYLSLHAPLNEATRHVIDREALGRMKSSAHLVNTARGELVDEAALFTALDNGEIAGVAVDVYHHEMEGIDPRWLSVPNALLLPHLGSATDATRTAMADLAARGLLAILRGERPENVVNPQVLP